MENNMKTLTPVPDEIEKTRDGQGKESDKGTGKGGLGNTPTILASICAICWIGLIAVVTFMWLKNGDGQIMSEGGSKFWNNSSLSAGFWIVGMLCVLYRWPILILVGASICGITALVHRKRDNNPTRVKRLMTITASGLTAAIFVASDGFGLPPAISTAVLIAVLIISVFLIILRSAKKAKEL